MGEHYGRRDLDRILDEDDEDDVAVTACETRPGRMVFTEEDNTDAWIATDYTVDVER